MFHQTGTRKKKSLTDPVEIISFASQAKQESVSEVIKAPIPSYSSTIGQIPEPKVLSAPSGTLNTTNLSIKKMLQPVEGKLESSVHGINLPRNSFHFDDVKMHWRRFANEMKTQGKETFYNAMIKREPKVKDDLILTLEVDNQVQVDYINAELENLITYLRNALHNFDISLTVQITKNQEEETKFLSGKDKFSALSRKYPNLHSLKTTFNLDVDY